MMPQAKELIQLFQLSVRVDDNDTVNTNAPVTSGQEFTVQQRKNG